MSENGSEKFLTRREAEILIEQSAKTMEAHLADVAARWAAHEEKHDAEQLAVRTALEAVSRERQIHHDAHERAHLAHEQVHALVERAVDKAEKGFEDRMRGMNAVREQLRDQAATFITRDLSEEKHAEKEKMIALLREDVNRRFEEMRAQIVALEKGDVADRGKRVGQGTVIAAIVGVVAFVGSVLAIAIVVMNLVT